MPESRVESLKCLDNDSDLSPNLLKQIDKYREASARLKEEIDNFIPSNDQGELDIFVSKTREYNRLKKILELFASCKKKRQEIDEYHIELTTEDDGELQLLLEEEIARNTEYLREHMQKLRVLLIPPDKRDHLNAFLEIRAGTGGDESALFAGDLLRMYLRYCEEKGFESAIIYSSPTEHSGYKEAILLIKGDSPYRFLRFESGCHRVQRVPATEAQGRIHTSACTVAVLPEIKGDSKITSIPPQDLRIDTFRASGAGGQHVNRTDSAVRITHLPSGLVVECQDERSQHKNKAKAMNVLFARLDDLKRREEEKRVAAKRRTLIGSGDRSERIRTYNFPQNRVTDHRINLSLYQLDRIIEGELDPLIDALIQERNSSALLNLEEDDT